jgi:hypothetical protein
MAAVAVVAVGLSLFLWSDSGAVGVWDGGFPLQATLEDRSGRSIAAVAVEPIGHLADAEQFLDDPRSPEWHLEDVHWVAGQAFTVRVKCSGRTSMFGRELAYHQFEALLIRIEYADGASRWLYVKIPDGRLQRRVSVLIP